MNSNFRIIKYLAIAFALALALGLISFFVNGGLALIHTIGLIQSETTSSSDSDPDLYQTFNSSDFKELELSFNAGVLTIQTGEDFEIEGLNLTSELKIETSNQRLIIIDTSSDQMFSTILSNEQLPHLTITIPENHTFNEVTLKLGASQSVVNGINTQKLTIEHGAGKLSGKNITAESGELNGGAGAINLSNCLFNDFNFNGGVGILSFDGMVTGKTDLDCGVGETDFTLHANPEDYYISINSGLGLITFNGNPVRDTEIGSINSPNTFTINGGVGAVFLEFNELN